MKANIEQDIIKGTLKPIVLKLITEHGPMYGYQITQRVKEITSDRLTITEGALYPTLHKLVEEGILITKIDNIGTRKRKYYTLTPHGKKASLNILEGLQESLKVLHTIFDFQPRSKYGAE